MLYQGREIEFPAVTKISFFKVVEMLEIQADSDDDNIASYAKNLIKDARKYPELINGFEDRKKIKKYEAIIERLASTLFPKALLTNEIKGLVPPFDFTPFYMTTRLQNILANTETDFGFDLKNFEDDVFYIYGASAILEMHYGYKLTSGTPTTVDIFDKKNMVTHSYRLAYNADLTEMVPTKDAPKITEKDYQELMNDFYNVKLWKEKFPPNSYVMRGVGMANLMDVTQDRMIAAITENLLTKTTDSFYRIMDSMRNLFGVEDLEGGFVEFKDNSFIASDNGNHQEMASFLLDGDSQFRCEDNLCETTYSQLIAKNQPLVITDTAAFDDKVHSKLSEKLRENKNIGSYIIAPLLNEGELLGFMEIASPRKFVLNGSIIAKLDKVLPIFAMAVSRFKRESQNAREAIIQQECTTIHPSVKWRFDEEADRYMQAQYREEQPTFKDIVFNEVYPLYGQLDIKGSSEKRNEAIKGDLLKQIKGIRKVLAGALKETGMPVYEEMIFRLEASKSELYNGISTGSEQKIQTFINQEVCPIFDQLHNKGGKLAEMIDNYRSTLDPDLGSVYELRKNFDTSVNVINHTLANLLDQKQMEAQSMFPHHFERYKTDGVEYNMYIGQSIAGDKQAFDHVFLNNLRLWQLMVTCELENRFEELKKDLDTPLEIASLILAYSSSLAVHFRMDEKRFDVEGAYNARYEIVKKRVDKAHIKGTDERITVPGKIAIIYNNEKDAFEYEKYLDFLQSKGSIKKGSVERLELEDLQGISGLKALRAEVNYQTKSTETDFSVDKILAEISRS